MSKVILPRHGRNHRPGGSDPIPLIEGSAIWGTIVRDGTAGALSITSGALNSTTTLIDDHTVVQDEAGVDCDIVSSPTRITIVTAGLYLVESMLVELDTSTTADYGIAVSRGLNTSSPTQTPLGVARRALAFGTRVAGFWFETLDEGDYVTQVVGQNSGSTTTFDYLSLLRVVRIPGPTATGFGAVDGGAP